jgi:CHAT domain-containing protein/Tfp pilus assembly protein PilF
MHVEMQPAIAMLKRCTHFRAGVGLATQFIVFILLANIFTSLPLSAAPLSAQIRFKTNFSILPQSQDDTPFNQVLNLLKQSMEKAAAGQTDEAIALADRALKIAEKNPGPEHATVTMSLATLAQLYEQKHDDKQAEQSYLRALTIADKPNSGEEPFFLVTLLNGLGRVYVTKRDFVRAEPLFKRALELQQKSVGADDPDLATTLTNLGTLYQAQGDYLRAEPLLVRALAIREKTTGVEEIFVIQSLKTMASLYEMKGEYPQAGQLLQRAVSRLEKLVGADNPLLAPALSDLAVHCKTQGDYAKAESLYQRAIGILEKASSSYAPSLATALDNLGNVYLAKGDYQRAEATYKRALAIEEKALPPDDPTIAITLGNLALLYQERRDYDAAEALLQRALAIEQKAFGPAHPDVATVVSNLVVLYYEKGDYEKAEQLAQRVLTIKEQTLGAEHPDVALALNNLAALKEQRGDTKGAESYYLRALAIYEKKLGPRHPETTSILQNLALLATTRGEVKQALAWLTRSTDVSEFNTSLILNSGSEEQKRRYLSTLSAETDYTVSLHLRSVPNDLTAARLAFTTILRRKGRALDAMTEQLAALRRRADPQDRALLDQLDTVRSQLATLVLNRAMTQSSDTEQQAAVTKLEAEAQRLEAAVSARSAEFRAQSQTVTIESVQSALPAGAALVEIKTYHPFNAQAKNREQRYGAARYAAYVLLSEGRPRWADLGEAAAIDHDVAALRKVLITPLSANPKQAGRSLYGKIMRPIVQLLGNTHRLFLSPDGDLNLIPFAALVDDQDRYVVEDYSITYLTSGRDLLRLQAHSTSKQGPMIFANPLFNDAGEAKEQRPDESSVNRGSVDLRNVRFTPLPGTAAEARTLAGILSGAKVLTGAQATEGALKQVSGPSILHIATHGFFLADQQPSSQESRGIRIDPTQTSASENPLLRSGLAFAGANHRQGGAGEDGVLTALEAAGLDLWGTKLVVLSACETGLGEVRNGEGVYGLRRALVLAGSESQVMSLWQVSDVATSELMADYYKRLQAGEGRSEALRQVQLAMIKGGAQSTASDRQRGIGIEPRKALQDRSHPFYWASFIQSGDWRSLAGK